MHWHMIMRFYIMVEAGYRHWYSAALQTERSEALHFLLIASASYFIPYYCCLQLYFLFHVCSHFAHMQAQEYYVPFVLNDL